MKQKKQEIKRNIVWVLVLSLAFLMQTASGSVALPGAVKLLPVLPLLSCICMFEKENLAPWYGLFTGLLLDVVSPSMVGYNALILLLCCTLIGWVSSNYFRNTLLTNLLCGSLFIFLFESLYWLFFVEFKQTAGSSGIYFTRFLPSVIINTLLIIPAFFLLLFLKKQPATQKE